MPKPKLKDVSLEELAALVAQYQADAPRRSMSEQAAQRFAEQEAGMAQSTAGASFARLDAKKQKQLASLLASYQQKGILTPKEEALLVGLTQGVPDISGVLSARSSPSAPQDYPDLRRPKNLKGMTAGRKPKASPNIAMDEELAALIGAGGSKKFGPSSGVPIGKPGSPKGGPGLSSALGWLGALIGLPWMLNESLDVVQKLRGKDPETLALQAAERGKKMDLLAGALALSDDASRRREGAQERAGRFAVDAIDRESAARQAMLGEGIGETMSAGNALPLDIPSMALAQRMGGAGAPIASSGHWAVDEGLF